MAAPVLDTILLHRRARGAHPLSALAYEQRCVFHKDRFLVSSSLNLQTLASEDGVGWVEVVSEEAGQRAFAGSRLWEISALVEVGDALWAVGNRGERYRWTGEGWECLSGPDERFDKPTRDALVAYDPDEGRLVMWGGRYDSGRSAHVTRIFDLERDAWRKVARSPKPEKDLALLKTSRTMVFDEVLYWEPAERRVVRVGIQEHWILDGDSWTAFTPKGNSCLGFTARQREFGPVRKRRVVANDGSRTLLCELVVGEVTRFSRAECDRVATFAAGGHSLAAFDPVRRRTLVWNLMDPRQSYAIPLEACF